MTVLLEFIDLFGHHDGWATEADGGANASLGLTLAMPLDTYSFIVLPRSIHMDIIVNNGKICNNVEISAAVKVHAGVDEKQEINK